MQGFNIFLNKDGSHKSTRALQVFFLGLAFMLIYFIANMILIDPLYNLINVSNTTASTLIQCAIIAAVGTAVCMLFFFLPDKTLVPSTFICLAAIFAVVLLIAACMKTEARGALLNMVLLFGAAPVVIGNVTAWTLYHWKYSGKESQSYD
ncbi:MAG: hypothetical protein MJ116_08775 [Lachnospiraceae bacterium]|nr:hypothetical protein [Lachnospiraceae bacterium]